jgi:hypothetical protein
MDAAGNATVVWSRVETEEVGEEIKVVEALVQASTSPAAGEFSPPDDLSTAGENAFGPEVAVTPAGAATVIWTLFEGGGGSHLKVVTRSPGGAFGEAENISVPGEQPLNPVMALNANGEAVAAWAGVSGPNQVVRAAIRSGGGGFTEPTGLSATGSSFFPAAAIDGAGNATVVWDRSNGTNTIIQAAGYDVDPPQLSNLSIPATGTVGEPVSFSVTPFDVWPGVATSFSFGDGSAAQGASVSHIYAAPGTYPVTATATDATGSSTSDAGSISVLPSYQFRVVKKKRRLKKGQMLLSIEISGPGGVTVSGGQVKRRQRKRASAGVVVVPVIAKGKTTKRLRRTGKSRVRLRISFRPDGGDHAATRRILVVLVKKQPSKRRK